MANQLKKRLVLLRDSRGADSFPDFQKRDNDEVVTLDDLRYWTVTGFFIFKFLRYSESRFLTYRLELIPRPFLVSFLIRFMTRGECVIRDDLGRVRNITWKYVVQRFRQWIGDGWHAPVLIRWIKDQVDELESHLNKTKRPALDLGLSPAYLRTDMAFGIQSGGSVGHIAGVLNHLDSFTGRPFFLTTDAIPTVRKDIETQVIQPKESYWDFRELPSLAFNEVFYLLTQASLGEEPLSFIYQRYSLNDYTGARLAHERNLPFVLEYNGSGIKASHGLGRALKHEALSKRIEKVNLKAADLVVTVSRPLKDELVKRGVAADKILVDPNGVDVEKYSPQVDGSQVRKRYGLEGKKVLGFIGTFGKWQGAEVLAQAFGELARESTEFRDEVRLLMIGDGATLSRVKEILAKYYVKDLCVLTGTLPQAEGPSYLAACDILVAPHVPNPDGTPYSGSPTQLFEYMAMGKGIVASNLGQIGEILKPNETALMVKPGDKNSLKEGLKVLIQDEVLRERLGRAAREECVAKYTWKEHARKIIEKLKERCG